jgi:prepilin-type N-terminal cleavage/methylation domain-containing protein
MILFLTPSKNGERDKRGDRLMNQKGITLIELLVVFVIIAIGAALIAPNIGSWLPNLQLRSATRDVVSVMRVAQIKAVSMNTPFRISFDTLNDSYLVEYWTSGGGWVADGVTQTLPSGVKFNTTFAGNITTFSPNSTATNGNVTLNNTKGSIKMVRLLGLTGRIKVE